MYEYMVAYSLSLWGDITVIEACDRKGATPVAWFECVPVTVAVKIERLVCNIIQSWWSIIKIISWSESISKLLERNLLASIREGCKYRNQQMELWTFLFQYLQYAFHLCSNVVFVDVGFFQLLVCFTGFFPLLILLVFPPLLILVSSRLTWVSI